MNASLDIKLLYTFFFLLHSKQKCSIALHNVEHFLANVVFLKLFLRLFDQL